MDGWSRYLILIVPQVRACSRPVPFTILGFGALTWEEPVASSEIPPFGFAQGKLFAKTRQHGAPKMEREFLVASL